MVQHVGLKTRPKDVVTQDQIPYAFPTDTTKSYAFKPGTGWVEAASGGGAPIKIQVQTQYPGGTNPTAASSTSTWFNRAMNTVLVNTIPGAALSGSGVSLPAGTYIVESYAAFSGTNSYKGRIYNTTDSAVITYSSDGFSPSGNTQIGLSEANYQFTLTSAKVITLQCYISAIGALGRDANIDGVPNISAEMVFTKIA